MQRLTGQDGAAIAMQATLALDSGLTNAEKAKLWAAADKLRGHLDAAEYKHVVLGLIFLKYISDSFMEYHAALAQRRDEASESDVDFIGEYPPNHDLGPWMGRQLDLKEQLETILGRDVELFTPSLVRNKWVRAEAAKTRQLFCEAPGHTSAVMEYPADEAAVLSSGSSLHPKSPFTMR